MVVIRGRLTPEAGAVLRQALAAACDRLYAKARVNAQEGDPPSLGQQQADALGMIAEAALRHLGVGPTLNAPAPVIVARHDIEAEDGGPRHVNGPVQPDQAPAVTPGQMPDLLGLSARDAIRTLMQVGLTPRLDGDGFVTDQSPRAGALLARGDTCVLKLGRRPLAAAGGTGQ